MKPNYPSRLYNGTFFAILKIYERISNVSLLENPISRSKALIKGFSAKNENNYWVGSLVCF